MCVCVCVYVNNGNISKERELQDLLDEQKIHLIITPAALVSYQFLAHFQTHTTHKLN